MLQLPTAASTEHTFLSETDKSSGLDPEPDLNPYCCKRLFGWPANWRCFWPDPPTTARWNHSQPSDSSNAFWERLRFWILVTRSFSSWVDIPLYFDRWRRIGLWNDQNRHGRGFCLNYGYDGNKVNSHRPWIFRISVVWERGDFCG